MTEVRVQIVSMGIFWFEARVSHIPRAKSVLAMVAKAGAVQQGAHSERNSLRSLNEQK